MRSSTPLILTLTLITPITSTPTNLTSLELVPRAACGEWRCAGNDQKRTTCIGDHDGPAPFWACVDACWIGERKVRFRLKLHDGLRSDTAFLVGSTWVAGSGVKYLTDSVSNDAGYGKDVCTREIMIETPDDTNWPSNKRIGGIGFEAVGGRQYREEGMNKNVWI